MLSTYPLVIHRTCALHAVGSVLHSVRCLCVIHFACVMLYDVMVYDVMLCDVTDYDVTWLYIGW